MAVKNNKLRQKGYTLIELIVVLLLLGLVASIAIPNVIQYINKGDRAAALEEQHNVLVAISVALSHSTANPREIFQQYTDEKVPSLPGSVNTTDPARWLDKETRFEWNITLTGVLTPGTNNPLYGT